MNKSLFLFPISLNLLFPLACLATKNISGELTPVVGYRQDSLKWTVNNQTSGQWKSAKFIDFGIKGKGVFKDRYVLNYDIMVGSLVSGTYHDKRYLNPTQTSSMSAEKVWSLAFRPNIGFGYKFKPTRYFSIIPQVGFIYDLLYLKTKKETTGPISAFKDTIQWYGPWIGFDTTTKLTQRWMLNIGGAYQLAFYNNSGNWEIPPSQNQNKMSQHGTGQAISGRIRLQYEVVKSVSLGGEADVLWKWMHSGHESRNFTDFNTTVKNKLTKVTASTWAGRLVLTKSF